MPCTLNGTCTFTVAWCNLLAKLVDELDQNQNKKCMSSTYCQTCCVGAVEAQHSPFAVPL